MIPSDPCNALTGWVLVILFIYTIALIILITVNCKVPPNPLDDANNKEPNGPPPDSAAKEVRYPQTDFSFWP